MGDDEEMSFSDEKLETFYQEFKVLSQDFARHCAREAARDAELREQQDENTRVLSEISTDIQGLLQVWNDANAVLRLGAALGRFLKWATGLAVVGGIVTWGIDKLGT